MIQLAVANIRDSLILTNGYVVGNILGKDVSEPSIIQTSNQMVLYVDFTKGSLTSDEIKVEFSDDGINWTQSSGDQTDGASDIAFKP